MPKIDTSKIGGFEEMSVEEKLAALLDVDIPEEVDVSKLKIALDKAMSEAAESKKALRSKMSEDEVAKEEERKAREELQTKYDALLEKSTVNDYKARYISQGYDEKLAEETAKALFAGNMDVVFTNSEKFKASVEQRVKTEVLKNTPKPDGAGAKNTEEKTADIEMAERIGRINAETNKAANDVLSKYTIGGN